MKTYNSLLAFILVFGLLLVASCGKDNDLNKKIDEDHPAQPGHIPGMGETEGAFTGDPFIFSDKVEIKGGIRGDIFLVPAKDYCQVVGSGTYVLIQLDLVSHLEKDTLLVLPAGLIFRAERAEDQSGILIHETRFQLRAGQSCKVLLHTYCINEHRDGSSRQSTYAFGPVTDAAPMRELIQLLQKKAINYEQIDPELYSDLKYDLQWAIWKITDGEGLTEEDKDFIQGIKNL